jgi:3-deoxy-manno-octulosonate cytidylyltransferase (CMP-KDO synthetase)
MVHGPVFVVIPARYSSTRFPGKSLHKIDGVSLLERTYRRVLLCRSVNHCIIATDDDRIADAARFFGADVVMTSTRCATGTDRIAEAVQSRDDLKKAALIVNVQGDEPCIDPNTITKVIEVLSTSNDDSIGTAVAPIRSEEELLNRNCVKCVKTTTGRALYFSRHVIPGSKEEIRFGTTPYFRHIGIYAYKPDFLLRFAALPPTPLQQAEDLEMLRAMEHGHTIAVAEVQHHSPDVNVPSDIEEVQRWIKTQSLYS